jgi:glucan-binding YG repeat protein
MQTGWITLGKKRYYLDEDGIMQIGTITVNGKKYTLAADGSLKK